MIVVDTSALMAVLLREPQARACELILSMADELMISAGTLTEALVVSDRRHVLPGMEQLLHTLPFQVVPLTPESARRAAEAYRHWGKGVHAAGLNLADCFAYALAKERGFPLLFVGNDFSRTDIANALG